MIDGKKGFTLIELLIVVAIIGILAAIAVPNFLNAQMRARVARCVSDMKSMHTAMEAYMVDNNTYPMDYDSNNVPGVNVPAPGNEMVTYARLTTPIAYMSSIPIDPFFMGATGRATHVKKEPVFQYMGPPNHRNAEWPRNNTVYTITSLGPDQEDQQAWSYRSDRVYPYVYNASNGVISKGDIYCSNHGVIFN